MIEGLGAPYRFINEDVDSNWYDNYMHSRGNSVRCVIVPQDHEEDVLGLISLMDINYINRSAELHIMIGDRENRGRGIGIFAVRAMVDHAFDNLNLRRIERDVLENNLPVIRLYEKTGFVREGIKRQSDNKNGAYISMIMMALIRENG